MVVQDKQADIAILRTLGATPRSIMAIFMVQGSIIGIVGTALGVLGGVCLALNIETLVPILEQLTHHQFLAPDVYYISDLPSQLQMSSVIRIGGLSLALGLLSTDWMLVVYGTRVAVVFDLGGGQIIKKK